MAEKLSNQSDRNQSLREKLNNSKNKGLALLVASAIAMSMSACGGEKKAGAEQPPVGPTTTTQEATPTPEIMPLEYGGEAVPYDIESPDEQFDIFYNRTLNDKQREFYDKMTPEYISTLSPEEITEASRVPVEEALDKDGNFDPKAAAVSFAMRSAMGPTTGSDPATLEKMGVDILSNEKSDFDGIAEVYERAWDQSYLEHSDLASKPSGVGIMRSIIITRLQDLYPEEDIEDYWIGNFPTDSIDEKPIDSDDPYAFEVHMEVRARDNYSQVIVEKLGGSAEQLDEGKMFNISMKSSEDGNHIIFRNNVELVK